MTITQNVFDQSSPNLAQCQNSVVLTYSWTLLPWNRLRDHKNGNNVWPIFADLGDVSGSNFIAAYCKNWKALIFKLLDLIGMAAFNEYHRAKIGIISKIHVFFSFYLIFSWVFCAIDTHSS